MNSNILGWIKSLDPALVSIVLPTFNRPSFLEQSLYYISNSTYPNYEVIVVDDGSTGHFKSLNESIIDVYQSMGMKIRFIQLKENSGTVSLPRNIGISYISGRVISPVDDDCFCRPEKFSLLMAALSADKSAVMAFGDRETATKSASGKLENFKRSCAAQFVVNKKEVGIDNGQFIYDAGVYEYIAPVISINACDWNLYKAFADCGNFAYVAEVVSTYIWHGKNNSLTPKHKRVDPTKLVGHYRDYFYPNKFSEKVFAHYVNS
jgi:glycosyltransferase involved in cell wall biosynthesis